MIKYLLFISFINFSLCITLREKEEQIINSILDPEHYDARIRPAGINNTDGPTVVKVNMFVRSINSIDDYKMEYRVQLTFRQQWVDERLKYDNSNGRIPYVTINQVHRIWIPDLFFSNENEGHTHDIMTPNVYVRIFPEGSILYSTRLSLLLSCPMNLKNYPMDSQTCTIRMASYGWNTNNLVFLWKDGDPVQVVKNLFLPHFTLQKFLVDYCNSRTNTGEYSCLKVDFLLKRDFFYYLVQIYIPCCMLVILGWASFWIDSSAIHSKIFLTLAAVCALSIQTSMINSSLPQVSYTKAIDIWTGFCMIFVLAAFLESLTVHYILRTEMRSKKIEKQKHSEIENANTDTTSDIDCDSNTTFTMKSLSRNSAEPLTSTGKQGLRTKFNPLQYYHTWSSRFSTKAKLLDVTCRIAFTIIFVIFNIIYWSVFS